jgi:hypothetical protein
MHTYIHTYNHKQHTVIAFLFFFSMFLSQGARIRSPRMFGIVCGATIAIPGYALRLAVGD